MDKNMVELMKLLTTLDRQEIDLLCELVTLPEQDRVSALARLMSEYEKHE